MSVTRGPGIESHVMNVDLREKKPARKIWHNRERCPIMPPRFYEAFFVAWKYFATLSREEFYEHYATRFTGTGHDVLEIDADDLRQMLAGTRHPNPLMQSDKIAVQVAFQALGSGVDLYIDDVWYLGA